MDRPDTQPVDIVNDGRGITEREARDLFASGLGEDVLALDKEEQRRALATDRIAEQEREHIRATGTAPPIQEFHGPVQPSTTASDTPPPGQPATAGPPPFDPNAQLPPQTGQPVQPTAEQYVQQLQTAYGQIDSQLQAIESNKEALIAQFGAGEVTEALANLNANKQAVEQQGRAVQQHLAAQHAYQQYQAREQAIANRNREIASFQQRLGVDDAEYENLRLAANTLARDAGLTETELHTIGPREAFQFLQQARQQAELENAKFEVNRVRAAARKAVRAKAAAKPLTGHGRGGPWKQGDGSLDAAAHEFRRIGIL